MSRLVSDYYTMHNFDHHSTSFKLYNYIHENFIQSISIFLVNEPDQVENQVLNWNVMKKVITQDKLEEETERK